MERHQISGNGLITKFFLILYTCVGAFVVVACLTGKRSGGFPDTIIILLLFGVLFLLSGCFLTWKIFKNVHPVYFDEAAFYWKKAAVEQKVEYALVAGLVANWIQGRNGGYSLSTITLNYTDIDGTPHDINFLPISQFKSNPLWVLIQCEKAIQVTRPDFVITNYKAPLIAEKEADRARKYQVRF